MASLDSLPGDQRAVLQLVLGRGRTYDEIARLLSIDPAAVRERAVSALDALGPQTRVDAEHRATIADYLLGQLPEAEVQGVRARLAGTASERAWARVVSSELRPLSSGPLPEIPVEADADDFEPDPEADVPDTEPGVPDTEPDVPDTEADAPDTGTDAPDGGTDVPDPEAAEPRTEGDAGARHALPPLAPASTSTPADAEAAGDGGSTDARSSRRGGMVVIAVAIAVVVIVLVIVLSSGGSTSKHPVASTPTTSAATTSGAPTTPTTSSTAKVIAQVNLKPTAAGGKAAGIAEVLNEGSTDGIAIVAQNVTPNTKHPPNAYAVWLYNSPTDAHLLGFVNPAVSSTGRLSTAGGLPTNASHYKQLIVTLETSASPKAPGQIILSGPLTGL